MKKLFIFLFLGIFLINTVFAISVNLISPQNNTIPSTYPIIQTTSNASSSLNLEKVYLCSNITGSFVCGDERQIGLVWGMGAFFNSTSEGLIGTNSTSTPNIIKIEVTRNYSGTDTRVVINATNFNSTFFQNARLEVSTDNITWSKVGLNYPTQSSKDNIVTKTVTYGSSSSYYNGAFYRIWTEEKIPSYNFSQNTYNITANSGEVIRWSHKYCDSSGSASCYYPPENIFTVGSGPSVYLNSNTPNAYLKSGMNIQLNITATDINLSKVWYNYNSTNVFINGAKSGIYNLTNITTTSNKTVTIYANDTYGRTTTRVFNLNYKVFENSDNYVNLTYVGVTNTFTINITSPNISSIKLNYNGTNYTANSYSSGVDTIIGTTNVAAPAFSTDKNVSFYWIFTMLDGSVVNNTPKNQTIKTINLGNTYANLIYNISVKDEATGAIIPNINVSMSYEVTYGTTNTSIIGTNLFNDNGLANKNISSDVSIASGLYMYGTIVYTASGYIGKTYSFSENNISSYKNITLYLSLEADSYVKTMYVTDEGGRGKAALFKQYTNINGIKTLIATEQLDSTGKTTIVFIPNIQYTFEFTNTGCQNLTKNIIFYDQSDYTQTLSCSSYDPNDYLDPFENMLVSFSPSGVFNVDNSTVNDTSTFSVNVSGNSAFCSNINAISFNVYDELNNLIATDSGSNCDVLTGSGFFSVFATGRLYILLDSGETKTLSYRWQKVYADADYSDYNILTLLSEVGNSDDILGIDWKFKLLFSFIGLFGIIIALTVYQRIYNFSNLPILIVANVYIWFMSFIGWFNLGFGSTSGGFTSLISQYALLVLSVIGTAAIISTKEDDYS